MKVLFVSHSSVIPNYQEKLEILASRHHVELTLLLPHHWPEAGKRVDTRGMQGKGFQIISAPIIFEKRLKWFFFPTFSSIVQKVQPDIIHVEEEPYSFAAWQAAGWAEKTGAKLVVFTWENLLERFGWLHDQVRARVLRQADHMIAGNTEAARLLEESGYSHARTTVLPQYGVNPLKFKKKNVAGLRKELGLKGFTVGFAGRLVEEKGILHLVRAVSRMDHKSQLLIIGGGPDKDRLWQEAVARRTNVVFVDAVDNERMPDYLNCMDALVLPSLTGRKWKEQFGRVLIEAQACEVPVIGSSSGAIPEVIGQAGLVFPEGDVSLLASYLDNLAGSASLRGNLGKKGRARVLANYTNERLAIEIDKNYKILCK